MVSVATLLKDYRRPTARTVGLVVLLVGGTLLASELLQGWFPHDEGALGQAAERVLNGEIPHRDFDDIYTGLLSFLHAGVFAIAGVGSVVLRLPLFVAAMAWLWSMQRIAQRFAPPEAAGLVALAAFVWGVPNYPAALPSWYILFAATFCTHALLKWHETQERRWLIVAGMTGGIAFLLKLSGIFLFLGGGLALMAAATDSSQVPAPHPGDAHARRNIIAFVAAALLVLTTAALVWVVGRASVHQLVRHGVPMAVLAAAMVATLVAPRVGGRATGRALLRSLIPFAISGLVPIALFFVFYAMVGGFRQLVEGVFITPFRRVAFAAMLPPDASKLLYGAPLALMLWLPSKSGLMRRLMPAVAAAVLLAMLLFAGENRDVYRAVWFSAWSLLFFVAIDGGRQLLSPREDGAEGTRRAGAITLACMAVGLSLIEYPFAAPIYSLYVLPLVMLAAAAAVRVHDRTQAALQVIVAIFFLAFGVLWIVPGTVYRLGYSYGASHEIATLDLPRGGLKVPPADAVRAEELIRFVQELAKGGGTIWAGPDAPEIYFYSGLPNQTRTLFDFLDAPDVASRTFVDRLDSLGVSIVVLKLRPDFSAGPTIETIRELGRVFPHQRLFPAFLVSWR